MMKKVLAILLAALMFSSLAACGGSKTDSSVETKGTEDAAAPGEASSDPVGEKVITIGTSSNSGGLDPAGVAIDFWVEYSKLCIAPLISYDSEGNIVYESAESYSVSDDQLTWTFLLRKDAKWSDGSPVIADDFINTIKRALDPNNPMSIYADMLYVIKGAEAANSGNGSLDEIGVTAVDDNTLQFTLNAPCTYFLKLITLPPFAPSKTGMATLDNAEWYKDPVTSLGNGAFYLTEYVQDQYYTVSKNPNYYAADQVKLDKITVKIITDAQASITAYKTGEIDVAVGLPSYIMDEYQDSDELFIWNMLTTKFILPNISVKPLDDVRVRKALALALNRSQICAAIGNDYQPTTSFVAEYMLSNSSSEYFSKEKDPLFTEDVETAKQLLKEAGYENGEGFPELSYNYPNNEKDSALAQAIQAQLKQNLNIDIKLNALEEQVCVSDRREGNFDLTRHSWTADFNDPINYLSLYTSYSGNNNSGVNDSVYDGFIENSNQAADQTSRNEYLHEAEAELVTNNFFVIPISTQIYIGLKNPKITNLTTNDKGETMYRYADITE